MFWRTFYFHILVQKLKRRRPRCLAHSHLRVSVTVQLILLLYSHSSSIFFKPSLSQWDKDPVESELDFCQVQIPFENPPKLYHCVRMICVNETERINDWSVSETVFLPCSVCRTYTVCCFTWWSCADMLQETKKKSSKLSVNHTVVHISHCSKPDPKIAIIHSTSSMMAVLLSVIASFGIKNSCYTYTGVIWCL